MRVGIVDVFFSQVNMSASSRNEKEEEIVSQSEEALEEVNSHIKEVFDILKRETLNVRKEMEAFDTVAKKLKHVHFAKTLKLNVGGQLFSTSLETMKKDSGSYSSLFTLTIRDDLANENIETKYFKCCLLCSQILCSLKDIFVFI